LKRLLKQIQESGRRTLITVQRDTERIYQVPEQEKRDGEHHWWDTSVGKSPPAAEVLNPRNGGDSTPCGDGDLNPCAGGDSTPCGDGDSNP